MAQRITMNNVRFYLDMYNHSVDELYKLTGVNMPKLIIMSAYGYHNLIEGPTGREIRCGLSTRECYEILLASHKMVESAVNWAK